jgi:hypothetical protein
MADRREKERKEAWYQENKEAHKARSREYYRRNREKVIRRVTLRKEHIKQTPSPDLAARTLHTCAVQRAKGSKHRPAIPYTLSPTWILEQMHRQELRCAATGIPLSFCNIPHHPWQPSLDRIHSDKGYTPDNTQVVVLAYNFAKNRWDHEVVLTLAEALLSKDCAAGPESPYTGAEL